MMKVWSSAILGGVKKWHKSCVLKNLQDADELSQFVLVHLRRGSDKRIYVKLWILPTSMAIFVLWKSHDIVVLKAPSVKVAEINKTMNSACCQTYSFRRWQSLLWERDYFLSLRKLEKLKKFCGIYHLG
ncbi:hypothetical protein [Siminovitchia terrae]|uniref:hypothetical protein n=1 Tax=Siminovitchia terrae TaxID=1914933 RepID=UPI001BB3161D|nr:hypothetical protein [Siminovitchia terrae]